MKDLPQENLGSIITPKYLASFESSKVILSMQGTLKPGIFIFPLTEFMSLAHLSKVPYTDSISWLILETNLPL